MKSSYSDFVGPSDRAIAFALLLLLLRDHVADDRYTVLLSNNTELLINNVLLINNIIPY
jgi:hypothetical protein